MLTQNFARRLEVFGIEPKLPYDSTGSNRRSS